MSTHLDLCNEIRAAICRCGGAAWNSPTGKARTRSGAWVSYGFTEGAPDVVGDVHGGRAIYADAKRGKDRLRPEQTRFLLAAAARGCYAVEVRDVLAFEAWLMETPEPEDHILRF